MTDRAGWVAQRQGFTARELADGVLVRISWDPGLGEPGQGPGEAVRPGPAYARMFAMIVGEFEPGRLRRVTRSWRPAGGWKLYEQGRHRRSRSVTFLVSAPEVDSGFYAVAATLVPSAVWVSASGVSRVTPWPVRGSSNAIADTRPELDGRWARILPTPGGETKGHAQLVLRRDP